MKFHLQLLYELFKKNLIRSLKSLHSIFLIVFCFFSIILFGQQRITGQVATGDTAIAGATVQVKGTQTATQTDEKGRFSINAASNATIMISSVGFGSEEVKVASRTFINIQMKSIAQQMGEVVVIGYGTQRKENLTGAISTVSGKELNQRVVTDPASLLQGQLPGLQVIQGSGEPGNENVLLQVRGFGTFSGAGNAPLVIIDGIPGSLSVLDPNNIESVTVLKDAASAAIYGSRAANGVILVTTKKGHSGRVNLEYGVNVGIYKVTALPTLITNSVQYMQLYNEAAKNSGIPQVYTQSMIDQYQNATDRQKFPNTNWLDYMFQTAVVTNHTLNISGGKEKTTFNVGLNYVDQPGVMRGFSFNKYNVQFNLQTQINKAIQFGTNVTVNYGVRNSVPQGSEDLFLSTLAQAPTYAPQLPDGSGRYTNTAYSNEAHNKNAVAIAQSTTARTNFLQMQGSAFVRVDFTNYLHWESRGGLNSNYSKYKDFRPSVSVYDYHTYQQVGFLDVGPVGLTITDNNYFNPVFYSTLNFNKEFGNHNITALGGYQEEYYKSENLSGNRPSFLSNNTQELNAGGSGIQTNTGTASEWAIRSYFGRFNYSYKNKYLLEADIRGDGSSRFREGHNWGTFPSISAGWHLSKEKFIPKISFLNDVKIRGSYGVLGNQNIGNYPYQDILSLTGNYPFDNTLTTGVRPTRLVNPDVTWESTKVTDVGADLVLLKNKLRFTFDWFKKVTSDILRTQQIPASVGLLGPTINGGTVQNNGFEFAIGYKNHIGQVQYGIDWNLQTYKNKLLSYGTRDIGGTTLNEEGYPYGTFYLYEWIGIFQNQNEIDNSPKQPNNPKPGTLKYKDISGPNGKADGVINTYDRTYFDGAFPKLSSAITLSLSMKNFDFSTFIYGNYGRNIYVNGWGIQPFYQGSAPTTDWLNRWTPDHPTNTMPLIYVTRYAPAIEALPSTYFLKDASFLRIKNINIGYTFNQPSLSKVGIQSLRVYFAGDNLLTFTKYPGLDPERAGNGRYVQYPQNKIYSFGVRAKF